MRARIGVVLLCLGGLAAATGHVLTVLSASGKDVVLVETVGVGQDEVEIVGTADVSLVVLVPGLGDEVQALKAGIMEIADVFVVNKADREGVDRVVAEIQSMLSLAHGPAPQIVQTIFKVIREIRQQGTTILLVEQNARMALKVADYAYVLETGQIAMSGPAAELANSDDVRKAYLGVGH